MNALEDMQLFATTVEAGSFTAAAERLGLSKQFVSRRLAALEARLGVRLLNRTTRRLDITELGREYHARACAILDAVAETEDMIGSGSRQPRGTLRLAAPMSFGTLHLSPLLPRFLARYPDLRLEIDLNDRTVDLIGEGYDMAIRIGALPDSALVARRLAGMRLGCEEGDGKDNGKDLAHIGNPALQEDAMIGAAHTYQVSPRARQARTASMSALDFPLARMR